MGETLPTQSSLGVDIAFSSDRLRLLRPFITDRVIELAIRRVIFKEKFFSGTKLKVSEDKHTVKLALLLVQELNVLEDLQDEEEALLRGIDADTLRERRKNPGRQ